MKGQSSLSKCGLKQLYVDIDGVVYSWDRAASDLLRRLTGKVLTFPSPSWNSLEKEAGKAAWREMWDDHLDELFTSGPAIFGAIDALYKLAQHYEVTLVTSRPKEALAATEAWLQRYGAEYDHLELCGRHSSKPEMLPDPPDFFIDDKPKNILEAQAPPWNLRDDQVFVFPALYNKDFDHPSKVSGWGEIVEKLEKGNKNEGR